jgi:mRNA interferase MazF
MTIKKWNVYVADLNPRHKPEPGKIRPVVVVQTNLLNNTHPTTITCPISTNIKKEAILLRVHLKKNEAGLKEASDILVDQVRAIDNSRFCKHLGILEDNSIEELRKCLSLILD